MFFKSRREQLLAKRQRLEDEIVGYVLARKTPPERLVVHASRLKMQMDLLSDRG